MNLLFTYLTNVAILHLMDYTLFVEAGLTEAQAKAYVFLATHNPSTPPQLSKALDESRTNGYKLLEQLEELGLAVRDDSEKKRLYWAKNPTALLSTLQSEEEKVMLRTKKFKTNMPNLINEYLKHNEQPGIRFFQGKRGIEQIYQDQLDKKQPIYIIRSWKDRDFFGKGVYSIWRKRPSMHDIPTIMLSPDVDDANNDPELDKMLLFSRTWMKREDYTAPVEWNIYGDNVSIISFGEEAMGMIIESSQIADSMRQLFAILQKGLRANKNYDSMPLHGKLNDDEVVSEHIEYREIMKKAKQRNIS